MIKGSNNLLNYLFFREDFNLLKYHEKVRIILLHK